MPRHDHRGARVLIADHHQDVRSGLVLLLTQNGYTVCVEAANMIEALALLPGSGAEIALVDIQWKDGDVIELLEALRELKIPALAYSMSEAPETIQWAFIAGASGYVTKREDPEVLLEGVRETMARRRFLSPRAAQSLASKALSFRDQ
ncbi:MAG: response regulator transcription factor [Desulfovibrio sp.]|nr:response regulator transcription factor [Desulfovibrio sp.]MBI4959647.1 response regulator transcription factor [Desulfovibrio sp.]